MPALPLQPAEVEFRDGAPPFSPLYGDAYHPPAGAFQQAQHVFLDGNELPQRWQGRRRFVVLETGFGLGNNFLATWQAWRQDAARCDQLLFLSIERHPLKQEALTRAHQASPVPDLAAELVAAWPPLTPNLHRLAFDGGRVQLLLALGDVTDWLPEIVAQVDAFYLDGFTPARNPDMWHPRLLKAMARLAAPGATAATWSAARAVRDGLTSTGFQVTRAPGIGGKFDITRARHAPAFTARRPPTGRPREVASTERHALIVGGGLAGCAAAWALAEQGWRSTVVDRLDAPASATSGNAAGLFHGIVNAQDGTHARFNRAAALQARHAVDTAITQHGVRGEVHGLLRLETSGDDAARMQALLQRLGLPPSYVEAIDADRASALSGLALAHPAWFYPDGGWVHPAGLARSFLERAGPLATFRGGVQVDRLARHANGWELQGADGHTLARSDVVVLANAADAMRLDPSQAWPTQRVRGQISALPSAGLAAQGWHLPQLPIAGGGYLLPEVDGHALFGATAQPGDVDPAVRDADHRHNLQQLSRLTGWSFDDMHGELPAGMQGRTGWRWVTDDRLPLIGALPDAAALETSTARMPDRPRFVPRQAGLFVLGALGSRGITWAALGGQVLASWITGAPCPVEAGLLDAIDPARFICRAVRRGTTKLATG